VTPYYDEGGITIYCGDCREILPELAADAVVTDAPYGIGHGNIGKRNLTGKRTGVENTWHPDSTWDRSLDPAWAPACLAAAPVVAWFGHWRMREAVERQFGMPARAEIVWAKNCHAGPPCPVARKDERIWLFSAGGIQCKRFDVSVWLEDIIPTWSRKLHRNQKPEPLMRRLVSLLLAPGQSLIDPFMGSGTTLVVARELGVAAVGIDLDEANCANAVARLAQRTLTA
jgi:site-specific DNA-methyltransferase (adenine-specific)